MCFLSIILAKLYNNRIVYYYIYFIFEIVVFRFIDINVRYFLRGSPTLSEARHARVSISGSETA